MSFSTVLNQPMPLVPYTVQQEEAMKNAHFKCLLQAIGLEIPEPLGVAYPVIPAYMSPRHLWENALMLSPISPGKELLSHLCSMPSFMLMSAIMPHFIPWHKPTEQAVVSSDFLCFPALAFFLCFLSTFLRVYYLYWNSEPLETALCVSCNYCFRVLMLALANTSISEH